MSETALVINHSNFKQNRSAYGFTLRDIADKAGVSVSTVDNYEKFDSSYIRTRNRDENARRIERALGDLIDEQIVRVFPNAKKEVKVMNPSTKNAYDRKWVADKVKAFCNENNITILEFTKKCGITNNTFSDSIIEKHPYLYPSTVTRIIYKTGWTKDMFDLIKDVPFTIPYFMQKVEKTEEIKESSKIVQEDSPQFDIRNRQLTFKDGHYYVEYDEVLINHVVKELTKEEFLSRVENN